MRQRCSSTFRNILRLIYENLEISTVRRHNGVAWYPESSCIDAAAGEPVEFSLWFLRCLRITLESVFQMSPALIFRGSCIGINSRCGLSWQ